MFEEWDNTGVQPPIYCMENIMISNAEIKFVNCYVNIRGTLCSTLQLKEEVEFLLNGEIRKQNFIHVFPRELKALVIGLTGFELDEIKTQRVLGKLRSIHMDVEGVLDENGLSHSFRVTNIEFTEEVIDALQSLAEVNGLSESFVARRNEKVAKAAAAKAKAAIAARAKALEAPTASASEQELTPRQIAARKAAATRAAKKAAAAAAAAQA